MSALTTDNAASLVMAHCEEAQKGQNDPIRLAIDNTKTLVLAEGWYFYVQSAEFLETRDRRLAIIGTPGFFVTVRGDVIRQLQNESRDQFLLRMRVGR